MARKLSGALALIAFTLVYLVAHVTNALLSRSLRAAFDVPGPEPPFRAAGTSKGSIEPISRPTAAHW
jgi:hypothetical protein